MKAENTLQYMFDFYPLLFPTRKHCLNHLFCVVGNGYHWIDGELVNPKDDFNQRYAFKEDIIHAKSREDESEFWKIYNKNKQIQQLCKELEFNFDIGLDVKYHFEWYPLSKSYSKLFNYPEDIKPDWEQLRQECINLLIEDGIYRIST